MVVAEVITEFPSPGVALLRINRPEVLNSLNLSVRQGLTSEMNAFSADPAIKVVVITGNEKAFAAGADLQELQRRNVHDPEFQTLRLIWAALEKCPKPLIAAVNGFALGGGSELAFHCDIIIAGDSAQFGLPEVKVGIMPGAGGTQRFLRAAGHYKAARYLLTGDFIPAAVASEIGLVSEMVPDAEVVAHALKIAAKISALPPLAVEAIKDTLHKGANASLHSALALEQKAFQLLFASEDRREGITAFLEKRKPIFKGR